MINNEVEMKKQNEIFQTIEKIEKSIKQSPRECLKLAESVTKQISAIKDETERAKIYFKLGKIFRDLSKNSKSIISASVWHFKYVVDFKQNLLLWLYRVV